jgi:hypothetical protein
MKFEGDEGDVEVKTGMELLVDMSGRKDQSAHAPELVVRVVEVFEKEAVVEIAEPRLDPEHPEEHKREVERFGKRFRINEDDLVCEFKSTG